MTVLELIHYIHCTTLYMDVGCADANKPPVANAGGTLNVDLPVTLVRIDGSKSTDDRGIISYEWTRDKTSLAAGVSHSHIESFQVHGVESLLELTWC